MNSKNLLICGIGLILTLFNATWFIGILLMLISAYNTLREKHV